MLVPKLSASKRKKSRNEEGRNLSSGKRSLFTAKQALESVETAEQNIIKTAETVRVIRSSYLNQESLLTDLLEAENALLEAKFNLTTAQTNVKVTHIRLLAIIGIL